MPRLAHALVALALVVAPAAALADTAQDLSSRIVVDGATAEFQSGESLFGFNATRSLPHELPNDSKWGPDNDFNQIRITWDARALYVAGEGLIWGNNMLILLDVLPGRGMTTMRDLNAWSRNFIFDSEFAPDLFLATWDGNTTPQLWHHVNGLQVVQQQVGAQFRAAATFSQNQVGRSMEFAIPWSTVFLNSQGVGTDTIVVGAARDTFELLPHTVLKIAGVITAGPDNTGGPDTAPDNTRGHTGNGSDFVVVDNFAILDLDRHGDRPGIARPDSVPDFGVAPLSRVSYRPGFEPPIIPVRLDIEDIVLDRPAFKPDLGDVVRFDVKLQPRLDPDDPANDVRLVGLSAFVFDLGGRLVRQLYFDTPRSAVDPRLGCVSGLVACFDPLEPGDECACLDRWDGRDADGRIVPPGVYILSVELEPGASRKTRPIVVAR